MLPELNGKLNGFAVRAPGRHRLGRRPHLRRSAARPRVEEINAAVKAAAEGPLTGILAYTEDPIVSTDIVSDPHSSIFDAGQTMVMDGTHASRSSPGTTTSGATRTAASSSPRRSSSASRRRPEPSGGERVERARHVLEGDRPRRRRRGQRRSSSASTSTSRSPTAARSPTTPGSARRCRRSSCCASAARRSCSSRTSAPEGPRPGALDGAGRPRGSASCSGST